jgi:hypothetical protein
MTIAPPPTKSIVNGNDLASDDASTDLYNPMTMTVPLSLVQSDDKLKRLRLRVLDCVESEEACQEEEAQQKNHEKEEKLELNDQGIVVVSDVDHPGPIGTV